MMAFRRTSPRLVAGLILAGIACLLAALDWPLSPPKPLAYFGTSASGSFLPGLSLGAEDSLVKAVDDGDLAFVAEARSASPGALPWTLGTWVAVEHARGMVAVYGELAEGSASGYLGKVKKGAILGTTGNSGWSKAEGVDFRLFDRGAGRWVNPLLILPPLEDKVPPLIRSAALVKDGKTWPLGETKSLPQGQYSILVDAVDPLGPAPAASSPAPYYVRLVVDGVKVAELSFDVASAEGGVQRVSSAAARSWSECWSPDGKIFLASRLLARGRSVIQVLVRDYAGNERQASWSITLE